MPEITLNIPQNSKFKSSLNEIDIAMGQILVREMRIADPRNKSADPKDLSHANDSDWLWDNSRVFQIDDSTTEDIFDTYLLRKNINGQKDVNVTYPLLGYKQNDIDTVFWGTGQRYRQWFLPLAVDDTSWEVGDVVNIAQRGKYFGIQGEIAEVKTINDNLFCSISVNNKLLKEKNSIKGNKLETVWFSIDDLKQTGDKLPQSFKAKPITGTYTATILCDTRDEAQYLRDHYILRISDAQIWFKYLSPTIKNTENQIFTVFGIPNLERYPTSTDRLKGKGYIYGVAFSINYWACLADEPLPEGYIETIRMNLKVDNYDKVNRIVISGE